MTRNVEITGMLPEQTANLYVASIAASGCGCNDAIVLCHDVPGWLTHHGSFIPLGKGRCVWVSGREFRRRVAASLGPIPAYLPFVAIRR
jgi:hypothetical protein